MTPMDAARAALKEVFGYDDFRPGQEDAVAAILRGRDVMAVMPTGAGKSICYQIPALVLPGVTLVVSPLISLMRDQVFALLQNGVRAAYLNSSLTPRQYALALENARRGTYKIIYVAPERLLTDGCIVAFDGWIPAARLPRLASWLDTLDCAYDVSDPTAEDIPDVPVQLRGNVLTRSMNCITEQYSMPAYDGVDPNPIMAPFFIFFFGMMMADMGYGLAMIVGSLLFLKKKRPDNRSFMEMIFWCGIMTFIFGALTGGFLGDFIPQLCKLIDPASTVALPSLFDPLNDTMAIMVGSLVLGAIQVFTGMAVSVVEKCRNGHFPDALFDEITWWIILAGGAMALLDVGSVGGVPVVLCIGGLMLLYGAGRGKKGFGKVTGVVAAVYNGVTGFFSDILSYVRLMALMLSGAVLAQVFNMLGATTGNIVTFIIISLVGNTLNLALNLLGCYVHDMRLQFLEFFGRFYKDGGKAFRPLCMQSNYVEIVKEEHEQ